MGATHAELCFDAFTHAAAVGASLLRIATVARIVDAAASARTGDPRNATAEDGAGIVITARNAGAAGRRQEQ